LLFLGSKKQYLPINLFFDGNFAFLNFIGKLVFSLFIDFKSIFG